MYIRAMSKHKIFPFCPFLLLFALLLGSCADEELVSGRGNDQIPVSFNSYLRNAATRATYPGGGTGLLTTDRMKQGSGFGVYTAYTGRETFTWNGAETGKKAFNFMWNEQVTWDDNLTGAVTQWVYDPLKYWPNDNQPADDQNNDTGNDPAMGQSSATGQHDLLSFYAYAPWTNDATLPSSPSADDDGIVAMSDKGATAAETALTYRLAASHKAADCIDLLWSTQPNRWKLDGAGYTTGTVDFQFIHALSRLKALVRTVVDAATPGDSFDGYEDAVDKNSRVLIKSVSISATPGFYTEGKMHLVPRPDHALIPYWTDFGGQNGTLSFAPGDLNPVLWTSGQPADKPTAEEAAEVLALLNTGVVSEDQNLFENEESSYLFLPTSSPVTLTVRVVYDVVTFDPSLTLNAPKYFHIVENDISSTAAQTISFEPNKVYTLRLLLGLTTVKFEVDVDDWAVPLQLDGVVTPWGEQTKEANVE